MRRKILPIFFFTISFLMVGSSIIYQFTNKLKYLAIIFIIAWFVIAIFTLLVSIVEGIIARKLFKKAGNDIDKQIIVCESILENCFIQATATICISTIFTLYLLKKDIEKAKDASARMRVISGKYSLGGLYNHYILSVYENDFTNAHMYYEKLMRIKLKKFQKQQETAKLIQEMIDSNQYNEVIYHSTKFEIVKEICLRYKNKEEIDEL